jgi:hypothetical protein
MPTFRFGGPDGLTYEVAGPEGATPEQAFAMLQAHLKSGADPNTPSVISGAAARPLSDAGRLSDEDVGRRRLPEGFVLDRPRVPDGFVLDRAASPASWGAIPLDGPAKWGAVPLPQEDDLPAGFTRINGGRAALLSDAAVGLREPEFGSDAYINAKAKKYGMSPEYVRGIVNSQTSSEAVKGFPILGGLANRAGAAAGAIVHPVTGAGSEGSFSERYGKNLDFEKEIEADYEKSHPGTALAANLIGGTALTGASA